MSNLLGGKQGTAYLGTNANQPPNWTFSDRDPTQYDTQNVSLGDLWLNQGAENVWILVSLVGDSSSKGSLATWARVEASGINVLNSLTGNTGGVVTSDSNANINVVGDGTGITFTGNPSTHTLTASLVGTGAVQTLTGSTSGGAIHPTAGNININAGSGITVTGTGSSLTITNTGSGSSGITSITGDTGGAQVGSNITFTGGSTGLSFNGSSNTITTTFAGITVNGGTVSLATDATTSTVNIGTGAGAKTVTLGSTNSTSSLTLNSGSGGIKATGVFGVTSSGSVPLFINSSGVLGTVGGGGGSNFVQTLTGSTSGGPISPSAGNININAGSGITVIGTANTLTIAANGVDAYTDVSSSPYVVLTSDYFLSVNSSSIPITIDLPNTPTLGRVFYIKDRMGTAATNNIIITTAGGLVTIDGATSFTMNTAYQAISIIGNGSTYEIF